MTLLKATAGDDGDFSLSGRVVLITGGGRGIGAATAMRTIASGGRAAITHLDTEAAHAEARALVDQFGAGSLLAIAADAADEAQMRAAAATTEAHFGRPADSLVINAADISKAPWEEIGVAGWDAMMAVNLRGAYVAALAAVPEMRKAGYGKIITIGSVMANIGDPRALHYVTSKQGLVGFTRSLARAEGGSGIRVNCVVPGAIATERHFEEGGRLELGRLAELQSVQRRGFADDIAAACQFLMSAAGDFISGQVLTVDGGWSQY